MNPPPRFPVFPVQPVDRGTVSAVNSTINECGTHDDAGVLQSLQKLKTWAEEKGKNCIHHTVIIGKVPESSVDPEWLSAAGYEFCKGSGKSNMVFWHKQYAFLAMKIDHLIHKNGTWSLQITPGVPQHDPSRMVELASNVLYNAFGGKNYYHVALRRFESSRPDSADVLKWLKDNNIREIKAYIHDKYEARVEITYLDPAFGPAVSKILSEL